MSYHDHKSGKTKTRYFQNNTTSQDGVEISMVIKCNPKDIVDVYVLVDITGCMLSIEPYCHNPYGDLMNEDGSPLFWELLATHLSVPMYWVQRSERMKDGSVGEVGSELPVRNQRLCFFETREEAYDALNRVESAIVSGASFLDLSEF